MKFRTPYNSCEFRRDDEVNTKPSLTVPDQTMSMQEILARYARGLPTVGNVHSPVYNGEDDPLDGIDIRTLDLSERMDMLEAARENVRELQEKMSKPPVVPEAVHADDKPSEDAKQ